MNQVTGLILAGGQGRRMSADGQGANKGLQLFGGRPMVAHVIERLLPQVDGLLINANDRTDEFERLGYPVISDSLSGFQGPLAGLQAGLARCETRWLMTVPCDSPFLPLNLVAKLLQAQRAQSAPLAVARNQNQLQPVFALVDVTLLASLEAFLATGQRKIDRWFEGHATAIVDFADGKAFLNVNTLDELRQYQGEL